MALKINGRNIQSLPLRFRGAVGFEYSETNKSSQRNLFASQAITDKASGNPAGHLYPSAWIWPQKSGSITAFKTTFGTSTAVALLALGLGAVGTINGTSTATATGALLANMSATSAGSATATATWSATTALSATAAGTSTATATATAVTIAFIDATAAGTSTATAEWNAKLFGTGTANGVATGTATPTARGFLEGEITPFTELSPENLAAAVWAAEVSQNIDSGSMGRLLYDAGGGASPELIAAAVWDELLTTHNLSGTTGEKMNKLLTLSKFLALK